MNEEPTASTEPRFLAPAPSQPIAEPSRAPTFSIVIATYEAADTVAAAVASALAQTHPAHEVIVVDDGSKDDPAGALGELADRVTLIRKPNGGGASALNAGLAAASGDFLAILDADDGYDPRRLAALAALAVARPDLDLITTDASFVVKGEPVSTFATHNSFATEDQRTAIFENCFVGGWPAIRRERLLEIGGFDETLRTGYDWDCWTRLLLDGGGAGMVTEPYYEYHLHTGSLTGSRVSSLWDRVTLLEKAADNPALRSEDRPALDRAIRTHRSRAVAAEAQAAVRDDGSKRRLPKFVLSPGIERWARTAAALALLAPPLARRRLPEDRPAEDRFDRPAR